MGDQPVAKPLVTQDNKNTDESGHISRCGVGLEPAIPLFEWAKTSHASDRAASAICRGIATDLFSSSAMILLVPADGLAHLSDKHMNKNQIVFRSTFFRQFLVFFFLLLLLPFPEPEHSKYEYKYQIMFVLFLDGYTVWVGAMLPMFRKYMLSPSYGSICAACVSFFVRFFYYLVCEAIGTAATPGLLCQPRVMVKMIVEKQIECRLAGETEVLGEKTCPRATLVHHKIPHDQTRV
jgi:hypothetical protein